MPFDGITTKHIIDELKSALTGGRIRKIYQPENDEIRLNINVGKNHYDLLMSANANNPRVYLTNNLKANPGTAPSFCMVLRKHLLNGTVIDCVQHRSDRIIEILIGTKNELGDAVVRSLLCEIMGRNANIILNTAPSDEDGTAVIIDCLKKVGQASNRYRQILPGRSYVFPPESGRANLFTVTADDFSEILTVNSRLPINKLLVQKFLGISPSFAREICYRAGIADENSPSELNSKQKNWLWESFENLRSDINRHAFPTHYAFYRNIVEFSTVELRHLGEMSRHPFDSVSEMLEDYYYQKDKKIRFNARAAGLKQKLSALYKKSAKKLQNLRHDLQSAVDDEESKLFGDLITANIWQIQKGMHSVSLTDYNDPELKTVTIPLKNNETPAQNAQRYYKKYNKAKRARLRLAEQIAICEEQTYYLDSLLNALEQCTEPGELDEIRHEFNASELSGKTVSGTQKKRPAVSKPLHYRSSEDFDIYVGKNNYQNDYISTRLGTEEDCWLHVKDIPGSHVLIVANGRFIPEKTVLEGGMLAAWHSKARGSENVPVDYVEFKFVRKPNKAKPGMVTFTGQNTMFVTPKKEKISALDIIEE